MTELEMKEMFEKANKEVVELRKTLEDKKINETDRTEKIAKLETSLSKYEDANQEVTKKMLSSENEAKELKSKLENLEKVLSRPNLSGKDKNEKSAELKAFETMAQKGFKDMDVEERKYLRTDSNVEGGFLAPTEYFNEIIKKVTEITPMRTIARVRKTSAGYITIPSRTTLLTATWPGEGGTTADDNSKYGEEKVFTHRLTANVPITVEMLNDSAFNMESEINSDVVEAFAKAEGLAFLTGNAINKPEGIMTNTSVQPLNSGVAASYTADNIITMCGLIKTGYNPVFGVNRFEISFLRRLKDGMGNYLWQTGIAQGKPNSLNGFPYVEMPDLSTHAADLYPVVFGDFYRGYTIVDGIIMTVVRDPYTLADSGKVRFVFYKGTGGKVTLPEAIVKLRCHV